MMTANSLRKREISMSSRPPADLRDIGNTLERAGLLTPEINGLIAGNRSDSLAKLLADKAQSLCEQINARGGEKVHPQVLAVANTAEKRQLRAMQDCIQKIQM